MSKFDLKEAAFRSYRSNFDAKGHFGPTNLFLLFPLFDPGSRNMTVSFSRMPRGAIDSPPQNGSVPITCSKG